MNKRVSIFWVGECKGEPGKYLSYAQYYQPFGYTTDILEALRFETVSGVMGALGGHYTGFVAQQVTLTEKWETGKTGKWPDPKTVFYND